MVVLAVVVHETLVTEEAPSVEEAPVSAVRFPGRQSSFGSAPRLADQISVPDVSDLRPHTTRL